MWDSHLSKIKAAQHGIDLLPNGTPKTLLSPNRSRPKSSEFEKNKIAKMLEIELIDPNQTALPSPIVFELKMNSTIKFSFHYKTCNAVTLLHFYLIPPIDKCKDKLWDAKML